MIYMEHLNDARLLIQIALIMYNWWRCICKTT